MSNWTTLDEEGNSIPLTGSNSSTISLDKQKDITALTGYEFSFTDKTEGVVKSIKDGISNIPNSISQTLTRANFSLIPFVLVGGVVLFILLRKK